MKHSLLVMVVLGTALLHCLASGGVSGIQSFEFEGCEVVCIQDAAMKFPPSLFTDAANTGYRPAEESFESSVNVFLVRREGKTFLIDAGNDQSRGSLREKLAQMGVSVSEITDVFITHIHPDHVGGLLWNGLPLFPNATIHIAKVEYEAWETDPTRSALEKYLEPYAGKTHKFEYSDALPHGIVPEKRAGHTPGHTIYRLPLNGQREIVFVGDIVHAVELQFPHPTFCARFDASPADAVVSRIQTLRMDAILLGAHFPFPGAAYGYRVAKGAPDLSFFLERIMCDLK
ncbi:MAG: MBL fold metallo-hydrolase [Victivallales bacterium]|nr:MBL fold metallo-hydrolase [Victivallales bacterium]